MAELQVDGEDLVLHLSVGEKILGAHGDPKVPASAVAQIEILEDAHEAADHGFRVGERIPGVSEIGTFYSGGRKLFASVHRSTPRGLRITFNDAKYDEWVVGCEDPEGVRAGLQLPK
ncbi:MAG: hypothetical protein WAM97_13380 [Acidimicrobiales bacterium]|jgi:hypothetical protein